MKKRLQFSGEYRWSESTRLTNLLIGEFELLLRLFQQRLRCLIVPTRREVVDPGDSRVIRRVEEREEKIAVDLVLGEKSLELACGGGRTKTRQCSCRQIGRGEEES